MWFEVRERTYKSFSNHLWVVRAYHRQGNSITNQSRRKGISKATLKYEVAKIAGVYRPAISSVRFEMLYSSQLLARKILMKLDSCVRLYRKTPSMKQKRCM